MNLLRYRVRTFFRYKDLIGALVSRDLKLKYRRSFLGYVWSVLNPLMIMIVLTLVFSSLFQKSIENFPVYLFTGRFCMFYEGEHDERAQIGDGKRTAFEKSLYAKIHLHGIEGDELHGGHGAVDGSADHCNDLYKSAVLPGISAPARS